MIKSIKFRNYACFLENQFIEICNENKTIKSINFLFGVPSSGKTSFFKLLKTVFYYMKRWLVYDDVSDIVKNYSMQESYNPNINNQHLLPHKNFIDVEIVFDNDVFSYKYELSFNKYYCKYEKLSYKINGVLDNWCEVFDKELIDYVEINNDIETIYETYVNYEDLEIGYLPSFKGINQKNSIVPYISSISKSNIIKDFIDIINRVDFFDYKDFLELKSFNFPYEELLNNKKNILDILRKVNIDFDDFKIANENKITGNYSVDLITKENKKINSKLLSKGEKKLFLYVVIFTRYKLTSKNIVFLDDFSDGIDYGVFFEIIQTFEEESINEVGFQIFTANNHFFNKLKAYNSKNFNIFDIVKSSNGTSTIMKWENEIIDEPLEQNLEDNEIDDLNNSDLDKEENIDVEEIFDDINLDEQEWR